MKRLNADKHSPASSARSTKRRVRGMLMSVGVESSHRQIAKRLRSCASSEADCECPLYSISLYFFKKIPCRMICIQHRICRFILCLKIVSELLIQEKYLTPNQFLNSFSFLSVILLSASMTARTCCAF